MAPLRALVLLAAAAATPSPFVDPEDPERTTPMAAEIDLPAPADMEAQEQRARAGNEGSQACPRKKKKHAGAKKDLAVALAKVPPRPARRAFCDLMSVSVFRGCQPERVGCRRGRGLRRQADEQRVPRGCAPFRGCGECLA